MKSARSAGASRGTYGERTSGTSSTRLPTIAPPMNSTIAAMVAAPVSLPSSTTRAASTCPSWTSQLATSSTPCTIARPTMPPVSIDTATAVVRRECSRTSRPMVQKPPIMNGIATMPTAWDSEICVGWSAHQASR
jgi:hypothetical protein